MRILVLPRDFPAEYEPTVGIFVLRQAQALQALGHDIRVVRIVPYAPPVREKWRKYAAVPDSYRYGGIEVRTIRALFAPRMIATEYLPLLVGRRLAHEVAAFRADLIHAHFLIPSGHIAIHQRTPAVVTAHGSDAYNWAWRRPGLTGAAQQAVRKAKRVVAVSDFIRRKVQELGRSDVSVVFNGADDTVFYPRDRSQARDELGLPQLRPVIAFAGTLVASKGLFDLLDAVEILNDLRPVVLVAGAGPEQSKAESVVQKRGLDVRFLGQVPHERLAVIFAAADVVTLPSYNEGLPVVVCEAMLAGRAVVATPVGGIPEIVSDGISGLLVSVSNPEELAHALRRVLEHPQLRERMEVEARNFASKHLTWHVNALAHDRLYEEMLAERL